jgi:hypothetical protein
VQRVRATCSLDVRASSMASFLKGAAGAAVRAAKNRGNASVIAPTLRRRQQVGLAPLARSWQPRTATRALRGHPRVPTGVSTTSGSCVHSVHTSPTLLLFGRCDAPELESSSLLWGLHGRRCASSLSPSPPSSSRKGNRNVSYELTLLHQVCSTRALIRSHTLVVPVPFVAA